ncbi:MAG: hypothetical protein KDB03_23580 [Planctomycetales bacterium]|nr:hypothetical protein [Planctomycetales bacterium]
MAFFSVHCAKDSDRLIGATTVAPHAGDMISELTLAMQRKTRLRDLANVIHPCPTYAEAIRKLGDQYNRTRLTPTVQLLLRLWLRWTN